MPLRADSAADLPQLVAQASQYQAGQSAESLARLEQILRDSAGNPALKAELERALAKLLAPGSTFEARRFACKWLAAIGTDASLPALAPLLADDETVGIACLALSSQNSPQACALLRKALASAHGPARVQIIAALGDHADGEAVPALAGLARGADAAVAEAAVLALGKIGNKAAHDAIAALAKDARPAPAPAVTEATLRVAEQLAAAGQRQAAAAVYSGWLGPQWPTNLRRGALAALLALDADGGLGRVLETISAGDAALVPVAIARVSSLKAADASATFAALLPRLAPEARVWMIEALASRADAPARQAIRAALSDPDAGVRRGAISALGKLEDASAVPLLAKHLAAASSPEEAQDAELALIALRGGAATDRALVGELGQSGAETKIRLFAILARRGAVAALPVLLAESAGSDTATVRAAFRALGRLASGADVPKLLDRLVALKAPEARTEAESAAARALAKIADAGQRSEAVRTVLAKTSDVEARCALLRLLPAAPSAESLGALVAAGKDKDAVVRDAAVRSLVTWPDAAGWDALASVVERPETKAHRALALRAQVRLAGDMNAQPDAALVDRYRQLLAAARTDDDRKLVLGALAGAAHPGALELALPLVSDPAVRAEAELAVKKIAAAVRQQHPEAAQAALKRLRQAKPSK